MLPHPLHHRFGSRDLGLGAKAADPRIELRADHDVGPEGEVSISVRDEDHIPTQPVQHRPYQIVFKPQFYGSFCSGEHAEGLAGVDAHIQLAVGLLPVPLLAGQLDICHLVHPEVLDGIGGGIKGHKIIVLIVPCQGVGAESIPCAVAAKAPLLAHGVFKVVKAELPVCGDGAVDGVDIIVDGFVHGLDPVGHMDLAVEKLRLVYAGQCLQLADKLHGLALGNEFGGLNAVHQQLQLRQLKIAAPHIVGAAAAAAGGNNVQSVGAEGFNVGINAFPLCGDTVRGQHGHQLRRCDRVVFIGMAQKMIHDIEDLQLLVRGTGHGSHILSESKILVFSIQQLCVQLKGLKQKALPGGNAFASVFPKSPAGFAALSGKGA